MNGTDLEGELYSNMETFPGYGGNDILLASPSPSNPQKKGRGNEKTINVPIFLICSVMGRENPPPKYAWRRQGDKRAIRRDTGDWAKGRRIAADIFRIIL